MGWEGKSMENCLSYWLRSQRASERCFSTCSIDRQPYNHTDMATKERGITQTCCHSDLQSLELKSYTKSQRCSRDWTIHSCDSFFFKLSFYRCSFTQVLAICNHACPCDVSCDCLLTCNCVKRSALLIGNARPHQCLMQSLSLFHFSPSLSLSLSLYLWKQPTIWYWSTTCH